MSTVAASVGSSVVPQACSTVVGMGCLVSTVAASVVSSVVPQACPTVVGVCGEYCCCFCCS